MTEGVIRGRRIAPDDRGAAIGTAAVIASSGFSCLLSPVSLTPKKPMRHRNAGRKFKRSPEHRRMLLRNLATALLEHGRPQLHHHLPEPSDLAHDLPADTGQNFFDLVVVAPFGV